MHLPKIIAESARKGDASLVGVVLACCGQLSSTALPGLKGQMFRCRHV